VSRPARSERGGASFLVVTCAAVLLLVGSALGVVAAIVTAHRSAQAAADLAALAGAGAHQRGQDGCSGAAALADANGARLEACEVLGDDVAVTVVVAGPRWLGQESDLTAQARAGPS
jgi:secretion/DNA translocation related TadE-like protein